MQQQQQQQLQYTQQQPIQFAQQQPMPQQFLSQTAMQQQQQQQQQQQSMPAQVFVQQPQQCPDAPPLDIDTFAGLNSTCKGNLGA